LTNDKESYNEREYIFGASGGASLYSVSMLREIGIFDDDFFAYYEDVDISFRAQLAGWKVLYEPKAEVYHRIGATSSRMKNFTVYHTFKNMPMVIKKNIPRGLRHIIVPRFVLAYASFLISAIARGQGWTALRGWFAYLRLASKKARERRMIQSAKKVSNDYILSILTHDLPENSHKLRKLRALYWKLTRRHA
jgi:GT2 family glycosyltransferase